MDPLSVLAGKALWSVAFVMASVDQRRPAAATVAGASSPQQQQNQQQQEGASVAFSSNNTSSTHSLQSRPHDSLISGEKKVLAADDDDLDPAAFLKSVRELSEKREREDNERFRKLEEDIEKGRQDRIRRKEGVYIVD